MDLEINVCSFSAPVVRHGVNDVTTLGEKKKAQPSSLTMSTPSRCSFPPSAGRWESHSALKRTSPGFQEFAEGRPHLALPSHRSGFRINCFLKWWNIIFCRIPLHSTMSDKFLSENFILLLDKKLDIDFLFVGWEQWPFIPEQAG